MQSLSVLIAAHNEEMVIESTLKEIIGAINPAISFEIYVSEDGSSDETRNVVKKMIQQDARIRLSNPGPRLGYSLALCRAIKEARNEILIFLDGDGQSHCEDLIKLLPFLEYNLIIVGYRAQRQDSKLRLMLSRLFKGVYRILGFPSLIDPSAGSVIAYKSDIQEFADRKPDLDFGFWWEFQAWRDSRKIEVLEFPVNHFERTAGTTKVYLNRKMLWLGITHLVGLLKLKANLSKSK
jgi:glycosyltransferase involved in cell wall biosynthesis